MNMVEPNSGWDPDRFMDLLAVAVREKDFLKIQSVIRQTARPKDIHKSLNDLTRDAWLRKVQSRANQVPVVIDDNRKPERKPARWLFFLIGSMVLLFVLIVIAIVVFRANPDRWTQQFQGTYTPTVTLTVTPTNTLTPTSTSTSTPEPTFTPTQIPQSIYLFSDPALIAPPLPVSAQAAWVINPENMTAEPPLTDEGVWKKDQKFEMSGAPSTIYYTEIGAPRLEWQMDTPLESGTYGIYILDSQKYSSGQVDFQVKLDEQPADLLRGNLNPIYGSEPDQIEDQWLLVGFFGAESGQRLTLQAQPGQRSPDNPFGLGRLLLVRLDPSQVDLLSELQTDRQLVSLLDDKSAKIYSSWTNLEVLINPGQSTQNLTSWVGEYRFYQVQDFKSRVEWMPVGRLAVGEYELWVRIPPSHANAAVEYALIADGDVVQRENAAVLNQPDHLGVWYSMGTWNLPKEAAVGVQLLADRGLSGEIGFDVVALVRVGD